jgi:hypothetical protein
MKKYLLLIFIFFNLSFLFAKNDQENYLELKKISEEIDFYSREDANKILFELGLLSSKTGNFTEAINIFEGLLIESDSNRIKLELAKVYFYLKEFKLAQELFFEVLNSKPQPPQNVSKNIKILLAQIKRQESSVSIKRTFYSFFGSIKTGYDDNIQMMPDESLILEYLGESFQSGEIVLDQKLKSAYTELLGNFNVTNILDKNSNFYLQSNFFGYQQFYSDDRNSTADFNIDFISLSSALNFKNNFLRFELPLKIEKIYFAGLPYIKNNSFGLKNYFYFSKKFNISAFLNYKYKDFLDIEEQVNNSEVLNSTLGINFYFFNNFINLFLQIDDENLQKSSSEENQIEKNSYIFSINYKYKKLFFDFLDINLQYMYRKNVFKNFKAQEYLDDLGETRVDFYQNSKIALFYYLSKHFVLELNYNFIINESNHKPVNYEKNSYSFGLNIMY